MKIRNGFVSNSSSTSFTFCYKGEGIKPLTDLILTKYRDQFKRSYDEWHCNAMDVVEAIERCFYIKSEWHTIGPVSIDKVILNEKDYLARHLKYMKDRENEKDTYWLQHDLEAKQRIEKKINKLNDIKNKGLTTVVIIGFGDNHGEVQGGNLGYAMDYDGRYIDIYEKDLVVFTEQNR